MIEFEVYWLGFAAMSTLIASVHVWFPQFDRRFADRQTRWVGFTGGIAIGYVTLYMLPKLGHLSAEALPPDTPLDIAKLQIYLLLLSAILLYLIMLRLERSPLSQLSQAFDYLVHGLYSLLVGYVFVEFSDRQPLQEALVAIVLALHLLGMTHLLRLKRAVGYDRIRWLYAMLVLIGTALGLVTELPKLIINSVTAFLAGIILVNVITEELPIRYTSRLPWFLAGAVTFVLIMVAILETGTPMVPIRG